MEIFFHIKQFLVIWLRFCSNQKSNIQSLSILNSYRNNYPANFVSISQRLTKIFLIACFVVLKFVLKLLQLYAVLVLVRPITKMDCAIIMK